MKNISIINVEARITKPLEFGKIIGVPKQSVSNYENDNGMSTIEIYLFVPHR